MTYDPAADDLLQRRLDAALAPGERAVADRLLEQSPEARARAAALDGLATLLDTLGPAEPPSNFAQHVLARLAPSSSSEPSIASGRRVAQSPAHVSETDQPATTVVHGGFGMGKKVMWGVAAAAILALVVMKFVGYPPTGSGTEGTIGAAKRYQAPQIDSSDVVVADAEAQAFMQSDAFDALIKDEDTRKLLGDAEFRSRLASAELRKSLTDPGIRQALADPGLARYLSDPELMKRLDSTELRDAGLASQLNDPGLKAALEDPGLRAALKSPGLRQALNDAGFRMMLKSPGFAKALSSPSFAKALSSPGFAKALSSPEFGKAMLRTR
jgi:anti-sigma factor RsiW